MRSTIICVDDEKMILNILADQLETWFGSKYNIEKALGGEEALEILDECLKEDKDVSCIISDYIMPVMKGDELLEKVKLKDPRIRKIMLTGYSSIDGIVSAINRAGLYRYITKPWDSKDLMLTLIEAIKSYEQEREAAKISKGFETLYKKYENLYLEQEKKFTAAIDSIVKAIELKDASLLGHSRRVAEYSEAIGRAVGMSDGEIKVLKVSALLHNIGKLVMKENTITDNEEFTLKQQILNAEQIIANMPDSSKILSGIKYQFEKYDGTGIFNMNAEQTPMPAKIIALAKYFDQLKISQDTMTRDDIVDHLISLQGVSFEPEIITRFTKVIYEQNL